jgi:hypothetical protein
MNVLDIAHPSAALLGLLLLLIILWEVFETIVLPRSVRAPFRLTRAYYRSTWSVWDALGRRIRDPHRRELYLSVFGPMSLIGLVALWAFALIVAFALVEWGIESGDPKALERTFYMSGATLFTLGYGDVVPRTAAGRFIAVTEAGIGFGMLAVVISYLPVLYQTFARREKSIVKLYARLGPGASGGTILARYADAESLDRLTDLLAEWEDWSAEMMESYQSYPLVAFYRSQREGQSWLAAVTLVLDGCVVLLSGFGPGGRTAPKSLLWQAEVTFAVAQQALVELARLAHVDLDPFDPSGRLPAGGWRSLCVTLSDDGLLPCDSDEASEERFHSLRARYEPFALGLAARLVLRLPLLIPQHPARSPLPATAEAVSIRPNGRN